MFVSAILPGVLLSTTLCWPVPATTSQAAYRDPRSFHARWHPSAHRIWVGPAFWANRLQDWRVRAGRLECAVPGPDRNVVLLTRRLPNPPGDLDMTVHLGTLQDDAAPGKGWVGFRLGAKSLFGQEHNTDLWGKGLNAGLTTDGALFINREDLSTRPAHVDSPSADPFSFQHIRLDLTVRAAGSRYRVTLEAREMGTGRGLHRTFTADDIAPQDLAGSLALVCHSAAPAPAGGLRVWFADWNIAGTRLENRDDHAFGPVLFAQHTLSRGMLKITAQMPPLGPEDPDHVILQIRHNTSDTWETVGQAPIDALSRTATFCLDNWDDSRDVPYRLVYSLPDADGRPREHHYAGTIRRDPLHKPSIVVAAFTGNNDRGFPNADIVAHLKTFDPDLLIFTGDQIYERVAGYGTQREPLEDACLDYLRKWYLFGMAFGELLRDRPCVCLPDDHDVYHGNLWGAGGRRADGTGQRGQDSGGYTMPAAFVNMVQRTQTSHLPHPYDPTPVEQNIGVYYCDMRYGGVSFALLEDRKFKSSPTVAVPRGRVVNGWFLNPDFDPAREADVPGAELLGQRQLEFLREWAADWTGAWMKVVASQTLFSTVATLPADATSDSVVPKLEIPVPGHYVRGDKLVADADSNGWPQTGRNDALREIRRAFAFHIAGDQHLGTVTQYGIDAWRDAGFAFCVPSIANLWPRRFFPPAPGLNRKPGDPPYTGDFRDGFGNLVTVYAVANPVLTGRPLAALHDRAPGYGIVRFNRTDRTITIECWPRYADPRDPATGTQYPGWPVTIHQTDNYARTPVAYLPELVITGMSDPVVQVVEEPAGDIVYTLRIQGAAWRPPVFRKGSYTLRVGEPGTPQMKTLENVPPDPDRTRTLTVAF